ncbi:hypothetical protein LA6_006437 (plasmid) [Marinibacterium anthonyi]|nr:hypothetical protein LA6_006437 [Marinibacterium anthonyi]
MCHGWKPLWQVAADDVAGSGFVTAAAGYVP